MTIYNQSNLDYSYTLPDGSVVSGNQPSNIVETVVISDLFPKLKSGDKTFLRANETSVHTVTLTNNSPATVTSAVFRDTMTAGASYVSGSVTVNGVSQPGYDPVAGFAVPDIPPSGSVVVTYTIVADAPVTQTQVNNYATLNYTIIDPISGPRNFQDNTNTVTVLLVDTELSLTKSVDRAYAQRGDTVHYTIQVVNAGNTPATSLTFRDPIPAGTSFVSGSVKVGGITQPGYNPGVGFPIPDLPAMGSVMVEFDVTVN